MADDGAVRKFDEEFSDSHSTLSNRIKEHLIKQVCQCYGEVGNSGLTHLTGENLSSFLIDVF